ncbi:MAG: serine/threonine protein kinase [Chloroflexi bacterium]|uniref:Serine/threonine protein kinase n=1 Tax=Candidatus Chlorohelix allophototropha TaxID=3003348 RepID=A0A8T7M643_9CHLR|nr:serine/threonine protein kinase [Chloroflexota bacterium]WJW69444.1 serine/threonine protein kinase [Chloroflexota bacterium L227-S17]
MSDQLKLGSTILNKYLIDSIIGTGGFGAVYKAYDLKLKRWAAIKTLLYTQSRLDNRYGVGAFEEFLSRFQREATVSSYFTQNPNIITVYGLEEDEDGDYYLILEFVEGGSLTDYIRNNKKLTIEETCAVTLDLSRALVDIHNHPADIVHRDLKPSNILLRKNGQALIADFGIAQVGHESQRTTIGARHPGSLPYMSPEQAKEYSYLSPTSDLYSLGLIIYEMLTGMLYAKYKRMPPSSVNPEVPAWLDDLVTRLLSILPEERLQKAEEISHLLLENIPELEKFRIIPHSSAPVTPPIEAIRTTPLEGAVNNELPTIDISDKKLPETLTETIALSKQPTALPTTDKRRPNFIWVGAITAVILFLGIVGVLLAGNGQNNNNLTATIAAAVESTSKTTSTVTDNTTLSISNINTVATMPLTDSVTATEIPSTPTPGPSLIIFGVGTTQRGDVETVQPADATDTFTLGSEAFGYINFDGGRPDLDKVELSIISDSVTRTPITITITKKSGFQILSLGKLELGSYRIELRYNGQLLPNQPQFKVVAPPTTVAIPTQRPVNQQPLQTTTAPTPRTTAPIPAPTTKTVCPPGQC